MVQQLPPTQPIEPLIPPKKPIKAFLFLEIGILEILFAAAIISIALFLLNFFSVIQLMYVYPPLAMLPTYHPQKNVSLPPQPFQYDFVKADKTLISFISSLLKPEFVSLSTAIKKGKQNYYSIDWFVGKDITFSANLLYKSNTNAIEKEFLFVSPPVSSSSAHFATTSAELVLQEYLKSPSTLSWTCSNSTTGFWQCYANRIEQEIKYLYTVTRSAVGDSSEKVNLSVCAFPKTSSLYKNSLCQ